MTPVTRPAILGAADRRAGVSRPHGHQRAQAGRGAIRCPEEMQGGYAPRARAVVTALGPDVEARRSRRHSSAPAGRRSRRSHGVTPSEGAFRDTHASSIRVDQGPWCRGIPRRRGCPSACRVWDAPGTNWKGRSAAGSGHHAEGDRGVARECIGMVRLMAHRGGTVHPCTGSRRTCSPGLDGRVCAEHHATGDACKRA
jgi:hypothetical protein